MTASDEVSLFEEKKPFENSAVWACVVYSLVPFVGVVFVPFIFVFGFVSRIRSEAGQRISARWAMGLGVLIVIVQVVLWWLLYAVPKWNIMN